MEAAVQKIISDQLGADEHSVTWRDANGGIEKIRIQDAEPIAVLAPGRRPRDLAAPPPASRVARRCREARDIVRRPVLRLMHAATGDLKVPAGARPRSADRP